MTRLIKTGLAICIFIVVLFIALFLTDTTYLIRAFSETYLKGHNTANIYDYKSFDNHIVKTSTPELFKKHERYNQIAIPNMLKRELADYQAVAYLIIKDGKLLNESYFLGHSKESRSNSFSIAKSVITMMVFKAINDGYIKSFEQPITDFLPEYKQDKYAKLATIADLSGMQSGYDWLESYKLPFNPTAKAYYGAHLEQQMLSRSFSQKPGGEFEYLSGATQVLAILLQRAVGMSLADYLSQSFWQPLHMQADAYWSLDTSGEMEKAYCCLNATARDFARLGQFMLNNGNWQGKQILTPEQVQKMSTPNWTAFKNKKDARYGFSVWMDPTHTPKFYAFLGHLGQRIIVIPSENMVIVRLGHKKHRQKKSDLLLEYGIYQLVHGALKINQQLN